MVIGLVILGVLTRLIPHVPNFSPLVGIALFSGAYLKKKHSFLIPLGIYIASDLIIGLHKTVLFTWPMMVLIYFIGRQLKERKTVGNLFLCTFLSSFLFFLITNFGVWLFGWYSLNLEGLYRCYILALPFFRISLFADFIYVSVLFGIYEYLLRRINIPQRSKVLS